MIRLISIFFLAACVQTTNGQNNYSKSSQILAFNSTDKKSFQLTNYGTDMNAGNIITRWKWGSSMPQKAEAPAQTDTSIKANGKFDFVPGEKVVAFEDFAQEGLGDFPAKWNTSSSGELKPIDGLKGKWLALIKPGIFYPEYIKNLPENFTLEYDVVASNNYSMGSGWFEMSIIKVANENEMKAVLYNSGDRFRPTNNSNGISIRIHPSWNNGSYYYRTYDNGGELQVYESKQTSFTNSNNIVHISIWKQKTRIRMYIDQEKVIDLPKVMSTTYNKIIFSPAYAYNGKDDVLYLSNIRLAIGEADTRNKLITEGKFVTKGILFETGSDKINPQSYGVLKDIAVVLNDNAAIKVKIVGHTDSDGDEAANLVLSKKRADAVKNILAKDFSVDAARMESGGKGETAPLESNSTAEGKANNRRVEFIKQ